jgi:hypothetical protein
MNFCCACLLCALAIATASVDFATERVAESCANALPCDARLPLADLPEQPHPSVNAVQTVVWSPDNAGH